ncbi:hypothetical protein [Paenibacillus sp. RC67]|uniref:hypothetical protein n=1 Tax=Paenibacillus sp. RC67 TaxID=3039392 RepID=UPI0024AD5BD2|nr:hypothetical protein [Paenibacillus sp. RC67]
MANHNAFVLRGCTEPDEPVSVIVAVAILPDSPGAAVIGIVHAAVIVRGTVQEAFVVLKNRPVAAPREHRVARNGGCGLEAYVVLDDSAFGKPYDHRILRNVGQGIAANDEVREFPAVPGFGAGIIVVRHLIVCHQPLIRDMAEGAVLDMDPVETGGHFVIGCDRDIDARSLLGG